MSDDANVEKFLDSLEVAREKLLNRKVPKELKVPDVVFDSDKALGAFIIHINEVRSTIAEAEKATKQLLDEAQEIMLKRLDATGLKNFAFEDLGTFSKRTSTKYSMPPGGKSELAEYVDLLLDKGIIESTAEVLDLQQSRLSGEPVEALYQAIEAYNEECPSDDKLPEPPFKKYEHISLSAPKKRSK